VHQSPLQRHIQSVFHGSSNPPSPTHHEKAYAHYFATPNAATAADQEDQYRIHEIHRPGLLLHRGLPQGWLQDVAQKSDLLTRTHSNARNRNQASFQPQKRAKGTNSWQLKQFAEATLGSGSLRKVVQLPEGEDRDEWLAVNIVDFYNQINLLYGAITEFCSPTSCPEMKATDEFEYLWHDPPTYPKPTYIANLLTWTSNHLSNPSVFPTQP
ncbi:putative maintenance of ploidy protein, partial [Hortaea werneckii]